jgi:hypothetical protein
MATVDEFQFPAGGRHLLGIQHPHLGTDDIVVIEAATRQWFRLVARDRRATLSMPSVVVGDLWRELTLHGRDYAVFCDAAFGRLVPHRPGPGSTAALLATLGHARRDEGCGPADLPLLFRVDQSLGIRDGRRYLADCGGRGECFPAPGRICLQHLAGPGKRIRAGGMGSELTPSDRWPGHSGGGWGVGDISGGGGGGDGGDGGGGGQ